jgi:hypothetical protein
VNESLFGHVINHTGRFERGTGRFAVQGGIRLMTASLINRRLQKQ